MSHFDSAITPVAGAGANTRRQSGCLGGTQAQLETAEMGFLNFDIECVATECTIFGECNCPKV